MYLSNRIHTKRVITVNSLMCTVSWRPFPIHFHARFLEFKTVLWGHPDPWLFLPPTKRSRSTCLSICYNIVSYVFHPGRVVGGGGGGKRNHRHYSAADECNHCTRCVYTRFAVTTTAVAAGMTVFSGSFLFNFRRYGVVYCVVGDKGKK